MMHTEMKEHFISLRKIINYYLDSGVLIAAVLFTLNTSEVLGQKRCLFPPSVSLSSDAGSTCYSVPFTLNDNTFGGSATRVTISYDGHGSMVETTATSSPFSFTYIPVAGDAGRVVTITVTTNNPAGSPCKAAKTTYALSVTNGPSAPVIENLIQPTCNLSTGSIGLSGLPTGSNWRVTLIPDGMTIEGSGSTAIFNYLPPGIYSFSVSVSSECTSAPSAQVEIHEQPVTPSPPIPGETTPPSCGIPSGSVSLTDLPATGTWTITRYPGSIRTTDTGTSTTISNLSAGTYNFNVTSAEGCISALSGDVTIASPPPPPAAPVIGTIVQPSVGNPTGSVTLTGLPAEGTWTLVRSPGNVPTSGTGTGFDISGLEPGTYTFTVRNEQGCISQGSSPVIISLPDLPLVVITDPATVCAPGTIDLTSPDIKAGSTPGLTFTYWTDETATMPLANPSNVSNGIYYIKGTNESGFYDIKPVVVKVRQSPVSNAGRDQTLGFQFNTVLEANLGEEETGTWISDQQGVVFNDVTDPLSEVSNLVAGDNILSWIVTNDVCPADTDKVTIRVGEILVPTLLTPNGDSKNEYFIIEGIETLGQTELTIFDRRGIQLFKKSNYDNKWNGVDYNDKPLMNDTYYFVLTSSNGRSFSGYIVIRR